MTSPSKWASRWTLLVSTPCCGRLIGIAVLAGLPVWGWAHRLLTFAWVEGATVQVQAQFSNGKSLKRGTVYVYDDQRRLLLHTPIKTDGNTCFALPDHATGLKIVVDAGSGHEAQWQLTPQDIETQRRDSPSADGCKP